MRGFYTLEFEFRVFVPLEYDFEVWNLEFVLQNLKKRGLGIWTLAIASGVRILNLGLGFLG